MGTVAGMLGNTPAVVRRSCVHRRLVEAFESGGLAALRRRIEQPRGLSRGEAFVAALLPPPGNGRRSEPGLNPTPGQTGFSRSTAPRGGAGLLSGGSVTSGRAGAAS